jgi:hypothetical protein
MVTETDQLTIDELTELRKAAKLLWESGLLAPHEKQHMWTVILRIDGKIKEPANERTQRKEARDSDSRRKPQRMPSGGSRTSKP